MEWTESYKQILRETAKALKVCLGVNLVSYKRPLDFTAKFGSLFGEGIVDILSYYLRLFLENSFLFYLL